MVKKIIFLFFVFIVSLPLFVNGDDVKISVSVDSKNVAEGLPFPVRVTITRSGNESVESDSFQLAGEALSMVFLGDSVQTSISIVNGKREDKKWISSNYEFMIDGREKGVHTLSPLSVVVGGKRYFSSPIAYQVYGSEESEDFKLKAYVEGEGPFYPGQRLYFVYQIFFKKNINLTHQELPLLDAEGFRRVGEPVTKAYRSAGYVIQEYRQEVVALKSGVFSFASSTLEARGYQEDFFGRAIYDESRYRASAPPLKVEISPFPMEQRPESFMGGVGEFSMKVELLSSQQLVVGDKIELKVEISGEGELETIQLPPLSKQEGFSENFRFNDLPPVGKKSDHGKVFIVEVRPLSSDLSELPSLEYSFFDPKAQQFKIVRSDPIPLAISPLQAPELVVEKLSVNDSSSLEIEVKEEEASWRDSYKMEESIEITGNYFLEGEVVEEAYKKYLIGESAETIKERRIAFNEALKLYSREEKKLSVEDPHLFANLGNCYFQLREYGWAIFYYNKALHLLPREEKVLLNLLIAKQKAGLPQVQQNPFSKILLFLPRTLSLNEQKGCLLAALLLFLPFLTLSLWKKRKLWKDLSLLTGSFSLLLVFSLIYTLFLSGIEGVIVESSLLRRDAGKYYAPVSEKPLLIGEKTKVLQVTKEGEWLKVSTEDGTMGYVPQHAIQIL